MPRRRHHRLLGSCVLRHYQLWQDCSGTTTDVITLVALPADGSYTALIQAQILTDADVAALDQAFNTLNAVS